ncbi:f-box domain protein [Fusarium sporotrichioides]|uniref:F-box domain protein n=1 Tax=Fusarium sporotrichioides TaxID=5514 RepID=A0A395RQM6_FUSSP|nr:f-box domain protein [Fusarium sporotrichioides]
MSHFENNSVASSACPAQRADDTYQVDSSHIYHLPDEILSQICSYATAAKALPLQIDDESQPSLKTVTQTAHALCLVSRRFNRLSTVFLFRSLVFTQTKLTGRRLTQRDLSSKPDLQEPHSLNKLFNLLRDRPALRRHCTSLCFNYREEALDDSDSENDDQDSSEDSMSDDEIDNMIPPESLLDYLYGQLTNVREFQVNVTEGFTSQAT